MSHTRILTALLAGTASLAVLTACGSDSPSGRPAGPASGGKSAVAENAGGDGGGGGGDLNGPCDVTDQATVASVFAGAGDGAPGKARDCEYKATAGTVHIYYFEDLTIDAYKKQEKDNDLNPVDLSIGDGAFRDQLGTVGVGVDGSTYAVQILPKSGISDIKKYRAQVEALAKKIAANL